MADRQSAATVIAQAVRDARQWGDDDSHEDDA